MGKTRGRGHAPEHERLTDAERGNRAHCHVFLCLHRKKLFVLTVTPSCEEYCGTECERTFDRVGDSRARVVSGK